jgi:superfamily II DNA or RNA helicase
MALAKLLGVSFASVNRWENGNRPSLLAWTRIQELERPAKAVRHPGSVVSPASVEPTLDFGGDPNLVSLVTEAHRLGFGHLFNPVFATEVSLIDPLPHQRIAVYERMLHQPRLRFLLADDAGAGKTIMAGLLIREMLARRIIRRVLVAPPAGLVGNWQREMRTLFRLPFRIVAGADARTGNPFAGSASDLLIVSLDTLAGERMFGRLQSADTQAYDLVIFDEAHKLSADRDASSFRLRRTDRYRLAEALAGVGGREARWSLPWAARHLLLLTATPHMGKDYPYYCLWRLLEPELLPTIEAFRTFPEDGRKIHFIRRTKEEMVRLDGSRLYPTRISDTLSFTLTQGEVSEQRLYEETTSYISSYYNRAKLLNRSAARLAMSVFQRRLASSTFALVQSLQRRLMKLDELIQAVQTGQLEMDAVWVRQRHLDNLRDLLEEATADEEGTDDGREQHDVIEDDILGAFLVESLSELGAERARVAELLELARRVESLGEESKFETLRDVLRDPKYRDEKILIFTEHRDTLTFLVRRLEGLGFTGRVAQIHGGMKYQERDEQVAAFRKPIEEGGAMYLVATDAAGEGINLQFCWLMVNYDVPWNPARLEQRMGRIHRYGQRHDPVVILNLVCGHTREGCVLHTLLEKLERIRKELRSDKVFDVVGRILEGVSMREYMAMALTEDGLRDAQERIAACLTSEKIEALETRERALYGPGGEVATALPKLRDEVERDALLRLLPGHVWRFVQHAAPRLRLRIEGDLGGQFRLVALEPAALADFADTLDYYDVDGLALQFSVTRPSDPSTTVFLHPGEPFFDRMRTVVAERFSNDALRGAVFVDPEASAPYLFHLVAVSIERPVIPGGTGSSRLETRLAGVEQARDGTLRECEIERLLLLRAGSQRPAVARQFMVRATEVVDRATGFARDVIGERLLGQHREAARATLPVREDYLRRGYAYQEAELAASRNRLADRVASDDPEAKAQLAQVKRRQLDLGVERTAAIAALGAESDSMRVGDVSILAHALVVPSSDPEDRLEHDAVVEAVAVEVAASFERDLGATVHDVSTPERARAAGLSDWPGFDLLSTRPDGAKLCIEVKGRVGMGDVEVSENEWAKACTLRERYWLYAVFGCGTSRPQLARVRDPFGTLLVRERGSVIVTGSSIREAAQLDV